MVENSEDSRLWAHEPVMSLRANAKQPGWIENEDREHRRKQRRGCC